MNIIRRPFFFILVIVILFSGCVTLKKPLPVAEKTAPQPIRDKTVIAESLLGKRIGGLANRIREYQTLEKQLAIEGKSDSKEFEELQESLRNAQGLLKTYREISEFQAMLLRYISNYKEKETYRGMIEGLFQELTRLEDEYFKSKHKRWLSEEQFLKKYISEIKMIETFCANKDYVKLIKSFRILKEKYGEDFIPANTMLCYADALSNTNQFKEAIKVAEEVINKKPLDSAEIRSKIIDWYLKINSPDNALKNFEKLSNEIDRKISMFFPLKEKLKPSVPGKLDVTKKEMLKGRIVEEDIKPVYVEPEESKVAEDVKKSVIEKKSPIEIKGDLRVEIEKGLNLANTLILKQKFKEAEGILIKLKDGNNTPQEKEAVQSALEILKLEEKIAKIDEENEKFMMAKKYIESEEYEKAINKLNELKDSKKYRQESKELMRKAIDGFARSNREEAAKLFLKANNTSNLADKKGLLLKSLELLKKVMTEYPKNAYSEKITNNIETIKKEILYIDPKFFQNEPKT
ncbi:MAG: hypothetical protein ABIJ37_10495 [Pseudomonadota bacterium]